jgi:uncharacterized protein (TIGR03437 family)
MVMNQDGSTNSPTTPVQRGQTLTIYCTGLGAVDDATPANAQTPVSAILNGVEIDPVFAGLVPAYVGLYAVTLTVPLATPPGIDLPVFLRQPEGDSNTVFIAIQ